MLNPNLLADFQRRDGTAVEKAFAVMAGNWASNRWLNSSNRYRNECIQTLKKDCKTGGRLRHKDLTEYIAASVLVHCMDGWAYLGRAINAHLVGDHDCARHLSYYAELRAAMAILGAHGVGVFSRDHVVVDSRGRCIRLHGPGTHEFVWQALEEWAGSNDARDAVLKCVRAGGQTLDVWLSHFSTAPALMSILTKRWLLAWGLDIARMAEDREARNLSSYRPTSFSTSRPPPADSSIKMASLLWSACEPSTDSPFAILDRQLLRASLREAFRATEARSVKQARSKFKFRINAVLRFLQPASVPGVDWEQYLTADPTGTEVLSFAGQSDPPKVPMHGWQVASRALLLLRIATGSCARIVQTLPISLRHAMTGWVDSLGQDRSLWKAGDSPASLFDLWKDPEDALRDLAADLSQLASYTELWRRQSQAAAVLSTCERVGLWGFAA